MVSAHVTCRDATSSAAPSTVSSNGGEPAPSRSTRALPSDQDISHVLRQVQLGPLLDRVTDGEGCGLDTTADWASILSLGEQQRLAFARYALLCTLGYVHSAYCSTLFLLTFAYLTLLSLSLSTLASLSVR